MESHGAFCDGGKGSWKLSAALAVWFSRAMKLPDGFAEDWEAVKSPFEWITLPRADADLVGDARMVAEEFREFVARWRGKGGGPAVEASFRRIAQRVKVLDDAVEERCLEHLLKVLAARRAWLVTDLLFKSVRTTIELQQTMLPELLTEFNEVLKDQQSGEPFDPEREYREAEEDADTREAEYRKALAEFDRVWPGRMDAELNTGLCESEGVRLGAWEAEAKAKLGKLKATRRWAE